MVFLVVNIEDTSSTLYSTAVPEWLLKSQENEETLCRYDVGITTETPVDGFRISCVQVEQLP